MINIFYLNLLFLLLYLFLHFLIECNLYDIFLLHYINNIYYFFFHLENYMNIFLVVIIEVLKMHKFFLWILKENPIYSNIFISSLFKLFNVSLELNESFSLRKLFNKFSYICIFIIFLHFLWSKKDLSIIIIFYLLF